MMRYVRPSSVTDRPTAAGSPAKRHTWDITQKEASFTIPLANRPRLVEVDPDNAVLMELTLEMPRDCWEAMLTADPA